MPKNTLKNARAGKILPYKENKNVTVFRSLLRSFSYFRCKYPSGRSLDLKSFIAFQVQHRKYRMLFAHYFSMFEYLTFPFRPTKKKTLSGRLKYGDVNLLSEIVGGAVG
jgi:hypothetical protein